MIDPVDTEHEPRDDVVEARIFPNPIVPIGTGSLSGGPSIIPAIAVGNDREDIEGTGSDETDEIWHYKTQGEVAADAQGKSWRREEPATSVATQDASGDGRGELLMSPDSEKRIEAERSEQTPGIKTGGYANDGSPDTRGILEKTADAITGDTVDDKTGKSIDGPGTPGYSVDTPGSARVAGVDKGSSGNPAPGIQTGGYAQDGSPDTRGIMEKVADTLTGDKTDDKTGNGID